MTKVTYGTDTITQLINGYNSLDSDFRSGGLTREALSVADSSGGLGSLSYNSVTGIITYTGGSDSDVRNLFSVGPGLTYDSASGQFDATVINDASNSVKGIASFDSDHFSASSGNISLIALDSDGLAGSAVVEGKIANDAVSRAKLKDEVELIIYNSGGSAVKTLYGAGS